MLINLDHLQNWLVYGHGLLSFQILAQFWLSEMGEMWGSKAFPGESIKREWPEILHGAVSWSLTELITS